MDTILLIDRDSRWFSDLSRALAEGGFNVLTASSGRKGLEVAGSETPDLIVLNVDLPDMDGLVAYNRIRSIDPNLCTIVMTPFERIDAAIKARRLGAFEYILKPFQIGEIRDLIVHALEEKRLIRDETGKHHGLPISENCAIIGQSKPMMELFTAVRQVARTNVTVLIRGESGTGKDLISQAIHRYSQRQAKSFSVIDCVAIPENLLESELFGYMKGAFTGADQSHAGKIDIARGGTLFLDEIGDMPLGLQTKILRFLQEKKFRPLGGNHMIPADVRIIAATNRDLEKALAEKQFREDLYYRLKVVTLWIPPLRDHRDDIPVLAEHFLRRYAREFDIAHPVIETGALTELAKYDWPGNIRELSNVIQKALIFSPKGRISSGTVAGAIHDRKVPDVCMTDKSPDALTVWIRDHLQTMREPVRYSALMDLFSQRIIAAALDLTGGNRTRAARLLGISRQALLARLGRRGEPAS